MEAMLANLTFGMNVRDAAFRSALATDRAELQRTERQFRQSGDGMSAAMQDAAREINRAALAMIDSLSRAAEKVRNAGLIMTAGLTLPLAAAGSGLMWMQGEWDYLQQSGDNISGGPAGVNRKATYKASFKTLLDDYQTDLRAITGQALPIPLFTYQTGARFTRDTDADGNPAMAIGMAQLETALERSDLWMVGPTYPVTDKGLHLDSNGSRWFGHQIAKVYHRVVHLGQDWEPLRPIRIEQIGTSIYLDFHVPEPPLVWDTPYDSNTARTVANRGFRVSDGDAGATAVPISAVELIGQAGPHRPGAGNDGYRQCLVCLPSDGRLRHASRQRPDRVERPV